MALPSAPNGIASPRVWTDDDYAFLNEQNGGPVEVPFFGPDRPHVILDFSGIDNLILQRKIGNPLLRASQEVAELAAARRLREARETADALARAEEEGDDEPEDDEDEDGAATPAETALLPAEPALDGWEQSRRLASFHDEVGKAIWIFPPWQPLEDAVTNGRRRGAVSVLSLTMAQRNRLVDVLYQGVEALASFREEPVAAPDPLHGDGLREEPVGLPDPERAETPEVLVRPGGVDSGRRHPARAPRGGSDQPA
jgi:hypothetical protein